MIRPRLFDDRRPKGMRRFLLVLFLMVVFSASTPYFTSAECQETGTLSVTTTPVNGTIYVDMLLKGKKFWSGGLNAGNHVIAFGDVKGYITPSPQTVTLIADQTFCVIGLYRKFPSYPNSTNRQKE